jgi:ribosomal-protein-alanine acetyltransferase
MKTRASEKKTHPTSDRDRQRLVSRALVRRMRLQDLESVMAIAHSLEGAPQWPRAAYLTALNPQSMPRRIALVAENEVTGAVVGFTVAGLVAPQAELETIAVSAEAQRHGIGGKLLSTMIEEMKAAAASEFVLEVRASNDGAIAFYRSLSWQENGRRRRYYADPEEDAVLMSRELG